MIIKEPLSGTIYAAVAGETPMVYCRAVSAFCVHGFSRFFPHAYPSFLIAFALRAPVFLSVGQACQAVCLPIL